MYWLLLIPIVLFLSLTLLMSPEEPIEAEEVMKEQVIELLQAHNHHYPNGGYSAFLEEALSLVEES